MKKIRLIKLCKSTYYECLYIGNTDVPVLKCCCCSTCWKFYQMVLMAQLDQLNSNWPGSTGSFSPFQFPALTGSSTGPVATSFLFWDVCTPPPPTISSNPKLLLVRLDVIIEDPRHDVQKRDENVIILVHLLCNICVIIGLNAGYGNIFPLRRKFHVNEEHDSSQVSLVKFT